MGRIVTNGHFLRQHVATGLQHRGNTQSWLGLGNALPHVLPWTIVMSLLSFFLFRLFFSFDTIAGNQVCAVYGRRSRGEPFTGPAAFTFYLDTPPGLFGRHGLRHDDLPLQGRRHINSIGIAAVSVMFYTPFPGGCFFQTRIETLS
ncbi:hypothetical protein J3459_013833 [Metarhizium acridum]|nr:hypothetical protein J3459_013833 [Metarhizium acridum]